MIEEVGRVVAVEAAGQVRVAVVRQQACGSCQARMACGQGLMQALRPAACHEVLAHSELELHSGDEVVLGVPANLLLRSAMLVYVMPLLALLAGALLGAGLGLSEPGSIVLAALGFTAAFVWLRQYNRAQANNRQMLPVVLRVVSTQPMAVQDIIPSVSL